MNKNYSLIATLLVLTPVLVAERVPGRYIVELRTEPVADHVARLSPRGRMQSPAAVAHRARVRGEQQQMRRQVELNQAQVLETVDTVANALIVAVPDNAAARLATLPGVKRVLPVRTMHMILDRAVLLHKVADAWNEIGYDNAGAGVKIAIIDSGIDSSHPGFQNSSLAPPDSFPRTNRSSDLAYTNGKIIVARSYVSLLPNRDPDLSARDHSGHGTALAMVAAGVRNAGPMATIAGVAPRAWLGSYKVFGTPGFNDTTTDAAILKALDDAVSDGMDIVNISLGDDLAPRLSDDLEVQAVESASKAGTIVVCAAGNNGPDLNTISSPATAPDAISVAATTNDRIFAASVEVPGLSSLAAIAGVSNGSFASGSAPITAAFSDVAALDGNGLACSTLPTNSLQGRIALILRGVCTFETKLNNAQRAGAVAAVVYAAQDAPDPFTMNLGAATLPAEMVSYDDGISIKQSLASQPSLVGTLQFTLGPVPVRPNRLTTFSAAGPNVDTGIKPDMVAVGASIYVATQTLDPAGDMYDPSGYIMVDGTSFSSPLVAGSVALIKSARPGLTVDQYRSLLINSAGTAQTNSGGTPAIQQAGAGLLDVEAALHSTVTAYPPSLSFGSGGSDAAISRSLTITNVGATTETFLIAANPATGGLAPVTAGAVELAAGASMDVPVWWNISGAAKGTYDGVMTITAASSGAQIHVPYWYAATSGTPAHVTILDSLTSARRSSMQQDAILFRITDVSGLALTGVQPQVTVVSGGGTFLGLNSYDDQVPGLFGIDVRLGPSAGTNVFRLQVGGVTAEVSISGL